MLKIPDISTDFKNSNISSIHTYGEYVSKQYMRNTSDRADLSNFVLFQHGAAKILITFSPQNFALAI